MKKRATKPTAQPYGEGTWFAMPLGPGAYGVGVVSRVAPNGAIVLLHLFGPARETIPALTEVSSLRAEGATVVVRAGDLHLIDGRWQIIGRGANWHRSEWPVPKFVRRDLIVPGVVRLVEYSDDPSQPVEVRRVDPSAVSGLEEDSLHGGGSVEMYLASKLVPNASMPAAGADIAGKPVVLHYLYFPNRAAAYLAMEELRSKGFGAEYRRGADNKSWLVQVSDSINVTDSALAKVEEALQAVADRGRGEYDGYERDVAGGEHSAPSKH